MRRATLITGAAVIGFTLACGGVGGGGGGMSGGGGGGAQGLENTVWHVDLHRRSDDMNVVLLPGGKVVNLDRADKTPDDDAWSSSGGKLILKMNDGYVTYDGAMTGNHTAIGKATNEKGKTWYFRATRVPAMAEAACQPVPGLENTAWLITDLTTGAEDDALVLPGGKLIRGYSKDSTPDDDSWAKSGDQVTFYINDKFVAYEGTLSGDYAITGTATNQNGKSWPFRAERQVSLAELCR